MNEAEQKQVDGYIGMVSHANKPLVSIDDQVAAAERELRFRIRVYPRWVQQEKISQAVADHQLAAMRAIVNTLQQVARGERLI